MVKARELNKRPRLAPSDLLTKRAASEGELLFWTNKGVVSACHCLLVELAILLT